MSQTTRLLSLLTLVTVTCLGWVALAQESAKAKPKKSSVEERVDVELVEVKVSISDKYGDPVVDVSPDEVRIFESGKQQRLAYFEPMSKRGLVVGTDEVTTPAPLYAPDGEVTTSEPDLVLPPKPVRRVVMVFDPKNSRRPARDKWRASALEWAEEKMAPGDQVGVVILRTYPEWIQPLTKDRYTILNALRSLDLYTNIPDRNRADEMTEFMTDFRALCIDEDNRFQEGNTQSQRGADLNSRQIGCVYEMSRPLAREWANQSEESFTTLEALSGQLASIPGEKIAILFSEGIIDDPAQVLVNSMLSLIDYNQIDTASMLTRLGRNTDRAITDLHERAAAANVAYFTLDSRSSAAGGEFNNLEETSAQRRNNLGFNPWREMYESTRSSLSALAYATGGRPSYGSSDLVGKIERAVDSFHGIYTLGYYRSDPRTKRGKINIKVSRKKLVLDYQKKPNPRVHRPGSLHLDLVVGRPRVGLERGTVLPLALLTPVSALPLRPGAGGHGCEVGIFVQAATPEGEVVAESFETVTIVLTKEERRAAQNKKWQHMVELNIPEGPMRLRARISDDRYATLADRSIDLTLKELNVVAGLQ